jgi:hypothetical protein
MRGLFSLFSRRGSHRRQGDRARDSSGPNHGAAAGRCPDSTPRGSSRRRRDAAEVSNLRVLKKSFRSNRPLLIDFSDQSPGQVAEAPPESLRCPPPCQRACSPRPPPEHSINPRRSRPISRTRGAAAAPASKPAPVDPMPGRRRARAGPLPGACRGGAGSAPGGHRRAACGSGAAAAFQHAWVSGAQSGSAGPSRRS